MTDLQFAMEHTRYYIEIGDGYPLYFPLDFGLNLPLKDPKYYIEPYLRDGHDERTVVLEVSSYRGYCAGAVHCYGELKADGVKICEDIVDEKGNVKTIGHCGSVIEREYADDEHKKWYESVYKIPLLRTITQEDVDDDPKRWEGYDPGYNKTNAFRTIEEVVNVGKKVAEVRFPNWKFEIKYDL